VHTNGQVLYIFKSPCLTCELFTCCKSTGR